MSNLFEKAKHELKALVGEESKDKTFMAECEYPDAETARKKFPEARQRLFNINQWTDESPVKTPFELHNDLGQKTDIEPKKGYFIKITLPGIPVENWVEITELKGQADVVEFVVHPCPNPLNKDDKTQHFFVQETSSTFRVERIENKIKASQIGRNEAINNQEQAGDRSAINTLIAEGGWAVFQKILWQNLADYWAGKKEKTA
jgi:hypothetical protein